MTTLACICGMPLYPSDDHPMPFSLAWQIAHRDRHRGAFPVLDLESIRALNDLVEAARVKETL